MRLEPSDIADLANTLKTLGLERDPYTLEIKACGANKPGGGGFSAGNTCARGGSGKVRVPTDQVKVGKQWENGQVVTEVRGSFVSTTAQRGENEVEAAMFAYLVKGENNGITTLVKHPTIRGRPAKVRSV